MTAIDAAKVKEKVQAATTELVQKSQILKKEKEEELPHFDLPEIGQGKKLGSGAFGNVFEISKVTCSDPAEDEARKFISDTCTREGTSEARYAVKILKPELYDDPPQFEKGCIDLAMEANFLSNFVHPNIIKVRGAGEEKLIGTQDYFLVMDRLKGTLEGRMVEWAKRQKKMGLMTKKAVKQEFMAERLHIAFELSSALGYMHARNIIYRDLKPENLGFDIRGDIKVFDLGFAKELRPDMKAGLDDSGDEVYNLTPKTGTLIYMAPEVVIMKPYSLKADVYSLAILLYEFMHPGVEPFPKATAGIHEKFVCRGSLRPKMGKKVPKEIASLMTSMWTKGAGDRPGMKSVSLKLKREWQLLQKDDGGDGNADMTRRRSTHVFNRRK